MTTENLQIAESTNLQVDAENTSEVTLTIDKALEKIKFLETNFQDAVSERDKTKQKLRKLEETTTGAAELQKKYDDLFVEKSKLHEQFDASINELNSVKENIKQQTMTSVLTTALEAAGAKSVTTVMKIIDKSKLQFDESGQLNADSVVAAVNEVRNSDPVLFGDQSDPKTVAPAAQTGLNFLDPGVKRAGEASSAGAFETEIKSAKNQREIENILRKYGKM